MTADILDHDLLAEAPYALSAQEYVGALTAFSHAMHGEVDLMHARLLMLRPEARAELLSCAVQLAQSARGMVHRDVASAALTPDALPPGVEGVKVGAR